MGWEIGFDEKWKRDIGYGVPSVCDHPDCKKKIDRGLGYVCGSDPYGGEFGCGLFFCESHLNYVKIKGSYIQLCDRCKEKLEPFSPKPDMIRWVRYKLKHCSWKGWRDENKEEVEKMILFIENNKRK